MTASQTHPTAPASALELESITKRFGGVTALADVTLRVRRGEVHGLVGENGAGKSTLLKILDGLHPSGSYDGVMRVDGEPVELHAPQDARALGIAIVPQETSVIDTLSVGENICFGGDGRALVNPRELQRRAAAFLAERGLPLDARTPCGRLSSSSKQLVMIARALYREPRVLILDEPTSALTREETTRLLEIVKTPARRRPDGDLRQPPARRGRRPLRPRHRPARRPRRRRDRREQFDPGRIIGSMIGRRLTELYPPRPQEPRAPAARAAADRGPERESAWPQRRARRRRRQPRRQRGRDRRRSAASSAPAAASC